MSNSLALGLAAITVIINALIGHFFAPNGISFTPIVLTITTCLVCFGTKNIKVIGISLLTFLFVSLNDILIKLYSGGTHDKEGLGFVHAFLFIGLLPAGGILLATILKRKGEGIIPKIIAVLLFVGLLALHLQLFENLGLGRHYWYKWND